MTYCLGMLCRAGAVFLSDSRTSAGMDNISMRSKMRVYEKPGDRVICILSSGNLSLTQGTMALIDEDRLLAQADTTREEVMNRQSLFETVRYVGSKVREIERRDRAALAAVVAVSRQSRAQPAVAAPGAGTCRFLTRPTSARNQGPTKGRAL